MNLYIEMKFSGNGQMKGNIKDFHILIALKDN